ncbi:MAG: clan AA aspartic protease [Acidobacteria bacterium]|nr:clan AA aspartic protease [Acidobacteriota bacterium]
MITGRVTAHGEAVVPLYVGGSGDQGRQIDTVIDTGFNGFLTLPAALIQELGLVWRRRGRAMLADGSDSLFDIYETTVVWNGRPKRVSVDEVDCDPLIGMSLLQGCELTVEVVDGGRVVVRPLP